MKYFNYENSPARRIVIVVIVVSISESIVGLSDSRTVKGKYGLQSLLLHF